MLFKQNSFDERLHYFIIIKNQFNSIIHNTKKKESTRKWKIRIKRFYMNSHIKPHENIAKYLGITLDSKLRCKVSVKKRRKEIFKLIFLCRKLFQNQIIKYN